MELIEKRIAEGKPVRIRLLKARQIGFSTLFEAIIYAFTSRREGFHSLVIAHDEEGSKGLFEMNKLYHEKLDQMFKPELKKSNEIALEFEGLKSRIDIDTSRNKSAGRSHTYQIVHKSESAYFAFPKEVNLGISNAVPDLPGTMIFDETTANGINFHFDECQKSIRCEDGYDFVFIPWFYNPDYSMQSYSDLIKTEEEMELINKVKELYNFELSDNQLTWRRFTIAHKCGGDLKLFCQEYPSDQEEAFIFSGRPRFDIDTLRKLKLSCKNPKLTDGLLDIYYQPDPLAKYIIGVDTSEGKSDGDKSSAIVLDCRTFKVAAEYNGLLEPDILAGYVESWANKYNKALAVVEINNHGLAMINELKKSYHNIYHRKKFVKEANEWSYEIGFQTNLKTKPILIGNLAKAIRNDLEIESVGIVSELMTFVINDDGSTSASEGKHDDRVIALGLCIQGYLESDKSIPPDQQKPVQKSLSWYDKVAEFEERKRNAEND